MSGWKPFLPLSLFLYSRRGSDHLRATGDSRPKMESIIPGLIQLSRVGHKLSEKVVLGLDWAEPWWFEGHSTFFPSSGDT